MLFPWPKVWWRCKRQSSWQLWRLGCMRPWISLEDSWVEDHHLFLPFKSMAIAKSSSWRSWFLDFICALYVFCSVSRKYMVVLEDCLLLNPPKLWRIDVQESSWVQSLAQWLWLQGRRGGGRCDCSPECAHKLQETRGVYRGSGFTM